MRIDDVLIQYGAVKKSDIKKILRDQRVAVNDQVTTARNEQVDSNIHNLTLDGHKINFPPHRYFMINKTARTLSANKDADLPVVFDISTKPTSTSSDDLIFYLKVYCSSPTTAS